MMHKLFTHFDVPPLELVVRIIVVYFGVLMFLRLGGKRQLGQMGPTEFLAILLVSNAVQNAMNGGDSSLMGGLISAGALVLMSWFISWSTFKSRRIRSVLEGTPTVLVHKGEIIQANLDKELLTKGDLIAMLRLQGIDRIEEAYLAVLGPECTLTVARHPADLSMQPTDASASTAPTSSSASKES